MLSVVAKRHIRRRLLFLAILLTLAGAGAVLGSAWLVKRAARGRTYADVNAIPHRHVGVVLGCMKMLSHNRPNLFFNNRIRAAAALFHAGKVDYLLVSGDNHRLGVDEPHDMREALAQAGVPTNRIVCDYAGFRTLDSVVRAREVFGQTEVTFISQRFHNQRAIFLAAHRGVDAIGFNAADVDACNSFRTNCHEQLARCKAVLDVYVLRKKPKFLGPKVTIGQAEG